MRSPADFPTTAALNESNAIFRAIALLAAAVGRGEDTSRQARIEAVHVRELAITCYRVAATFPPSWLQGPGTDTFQPGIDLASEVGRRDLVVRLLHLAECGLSGVNRCQPGAAGIDYDKLARVLEMIAAREWTEVKVKEVVGSTKVAPKRVCKPRARAAA